MERLTYDCYFGDIHWWHVKGAGNLGCRQVCEEQEENGCKGCPIELAFDRLAAYEDTGFTPEEVQQMRWISVEERLPEQENTQVLMTDGECHYISSRNNMVRFLDCEGIFIPGKAGAGVKVTHWMPLPPSPPAKGEK